MITLTVQDNDGAESSTKVRITVTDNRPDLFVSDIVWTPSDPVENDEVEITAFIGNNGKGASKQGFLVGFYIDNQYMGYTRIDKSINVGESIPVRFSWTGKSGVHVLKVVANDLLQFERNRQEKQFAVALSTKQVYFLM